MSSVANTEQKCLFNVFVLLLLSFVVSPFSCSLSITTGFGGVFTDNFTCVPLIHLSVCSPCFKFEVVISVPAFRFSVLSLLCLCP